MINSGQKIGGFSYDDYVREQEWLNRDIEYAKKDEKCIEIKNESNTKKYFITVFVGVYMVIVVKNFLYAM